MSAASKPKRGAGLERLLRFLGDGPAAMVPFEGLAMLSREGGARLLVSDAPWRDALGRGLMQETEGRASLTPAGRAALRRSGDADGFQAQHRDVERRKVPTRTGWHDVSVNRNESPLGRLHGRRDRQGRAWIDDAALAAGERLRRDFDRAQFAPRMSASWDPTARCSPRTGAGSNADAGDGALDARARMRSALDDMPPDLRGVVVDVCCYLKGLETVERERHWPPRSAKLMLRTGLEQLSRHYGTVAGVRRDGSTARRVRTSGTPSRKR